MRKLVSMLAICSFIIGTASAPALAGPKNHRTVAASSVISQPPSMTFGSSLVTEARKYLGTNPTGRGSLWCGAFMDLVLKRTGHKGGGNLASAYARYGTRVSGPRVGAIAVMGRQGGGHVGIVTGVDPNGNPIVLSRNTWNRKTGGRRTVAEGVYPKNRGDAHALP